MPAATVGDPQSAWPGQPRAYAHLADGRRQGVDNDGHGAAAMDQSVGMGTAGAATTHNSALPPFSLGASAFPHLLYTSMVQETLFPE